MQLGKRYRLFTWLGSVLLALGSLGCTRQPVAAPADEPVEQLTSTSPMELPQPTLTTQHWLADNRPVAQVYVVTIPPDYPVAVASSKTLETVETFAAETGAWVVLNGGFFDPQNAQTTSFVTIQGDLVADPRANQRLIENLDLAPYLAQILNRSEFRRYDCADGIRYDIVFHHAPSADGCTVNSALGAGPQLLPTDTSRREGFTDYVENRLIRDAIGSQQRNARSAIGIKPDGSVVWVMVAQMQLDGGMTLSELTEFMANLGVEKALNLDGGSSSSLYVALPGDVGYPQIYVGKKTVEGNRIQRPVKSVLLLKPPGS